MEKKEREDIIFNKKTLDFLLQITEIIGSSNAIVGRNDEMFAIDASKASNFLDDENLDIESLFFDTLLKFETDDTFGKMRIVTATYRVNDIVFLVVTPDLFFGEGKKENFAYIEHVKNWFLSIPKFTEKDKSIFEDCYQQSKHAFNLALSENLSDFFAENFSADNAETNNDKPKKLH